MVTGLLRKSLSSTHLLHEKEVIPMLAENNGHLSSHGRYSKFAFDGTVITFIHSKDLVRYLEVKEWDKGYLVVKCLGKVKGEYEDYIDLSYILQNLYMDPDRSLNDINGVVIDNA